MTATSIAAASPARELILTDFTEETSDLGWFVVNDNVMGGRSSGDFEAHDDELHFTGVTNTNGGGFSSIRTAPVYVNLADYEGIRLRVKADGRRYTWRLTTDALWRGRSISYWADFDTIEGDWTTVDIPFENFKPKFRGFALPGPSLDPRSITGMGLMIYDKQDGPFDLKLQSVRAYPPGSTFSLEGYQWDKRVLVVSAPSDSHADLVRLEEEVAASDDEFADRDLVLITLFDNTASTAGDKLLSHVETAATRNALGIRSGAFAVRLIGKDGAVKLSRESATSLDEVYALIDTMPMRRSEMARAAD